MAAKDDDLMQRLGNPRATDIPHILTQADKYLGKTLAYGGEKLKELGEEHYDKGNYGRAGMLKVAGSAMEKVGEVIEGSKQGSVTFNGGTGLEKLYGATMNANPGEESRDKNSPAGGAASWTSGETPPGGGGGAPRPGGRVMGGHR
ncbi:MAG: hypothetical protein K2Q14_07845 [Gammaproteobacteria bacterium]|nr:hypothetical protein [Gammaproteobacteria bacterium]MBY0545441.1 hypothetical protein [Gammaproteobacteria bacterium]